MSRDRTDVVVDAAAQYWSATVHTPEELKQRARAVIASHARDVDDCRELLRMLGLQSQQAMNEPLRPAAHGTSAAYMQHRVDRTATCAACRHAARLEQGLKRMHERPAPLPGCHICGSIFPTHRCHAEAEQ